MIELHLVALYKRSVLRCKVQQRFIAQSNDQLAGRVDASSRDFLS